MRTFFFSVVFFLFGSTCLFSQTHKTNPWSFIPETGLTEKSQQRQIVPQAYAPLSLDISQMQSLLSEAPMWMTDDAKNKPVVLTLPMPDGTFQDFRIVEAPVMHPDLAAQFPMIKTYAGTGIDDPQAYLRFDLTQRGFHAMVRSPNSSTVFIDPYSTADIDHYISYYRKDFHKSDPWACHFDEVNKKKESGIVPQLFEKAGDCQFRTYTLALACTGEYAIFHGGTTALALAAMVTTMTRVNGVFEADASVHMELHPNNTALIFLNPATDPYSNGNGSAMLGQNQTTCDNIIGNANYDIGHVFSTGGGGVAYLGAVCSNSIKAGGVSGQANPVGDPFDVDYVAHEIGHQYGANHTQNNNCNRNGATAMEPGSASTIMGYAGICAPNVQNNSDDYFHAISLQEMGIFLTSNSSGGGNTCSTNTTINAPPTANAGPNYTIPRSTPFVLTGIGTDPDGDPLTFCWEQMNNQTATMPPLPTNTTGPAFRSRKAITSPSRYLPRLQDLVNNVSPTWEVLASVGRTYSWRFTVRDNHIGGGCTAEGNMTVTVSAASGPFLVTAPNTAVTWPALSQQTVTWDVANTTAAPVNCANVDIFLSLDGGFTYPDTLATGVPNNGSYVVTLPNSQTTQARVMVKGAGNIFFDISNVNFTIAEPLNDFSLSASPMTTGVCVPGEAVFEITIGALGTFTGDVTLDLTGLPTGLVADFSENPVAAPGTSTLTISNTGAAATGTYPLTLTGDGSTGQKTRNLTLTLSDGLPDAPVLLLPAVGATGVSTTPLLTWEAVAGATAYELQVASDAAFSNMVVDETGLTNTEFAISTALNINTTFYWRVKTTNYCGEGAFAAAFDFTTINIVCTTFVSTDVPKVIPSNAATTITSTMNIPVSGTITDVNVLNLNIQHTWINDLIVRVTSPSGTIRNILNQPCGSQDNILINFDDQSPNAYGTFPCPPTNNGTYQPFQTLAPFNGQNLNGNWILSVQDVFNQDGGSLQAWGLEICYTPTCTAPIVTAPTVGQPTCSAPSGSILLNASGNGPLEYSADNGATWQITAQFDGLAPGSFDLLVRLQSDPTCVTAYAGNPVVINAVPMLPVMTAPTVGQPTCATPTGSISLNASGNGALEYSADNGATWQATAQFDGLAPGSYDLLVRLQSDPTCVTAWAGNPVVINAVPVAPIVTAPTVGQPTCSAPSGNILLNASGNGALEYSADNGATWQASAQFDGLAPGNYDLLVRLQSDPTCETAWAGNPVIITAPAFPVVNTPSVVQPTCAVPTGGILINTSGTGILEHSLDGGTTWQLSNLFTNVPHGEYEIAVRLLSDPECYTFYSGNPVVLEEATGCCPIQLAVDLSPMASGVYEASEIITSTGTVASWGDVTFGAGISIELLPGFEVALGGVFEVVLQGCVP